MPQNVKISFGIPKNPQIVSFEGAKIGTGQTGQFIAKPFTPFASSSELEVTTTSTIIGKKIGTSKIGLTKVDIFGAKLLGSGKTITQGFKKLNTGSSSLTSSQTSGYGVISISAGINKIVSSISPTKTISSTPISRTTTSTSFIDYYPPSYPSTPSRVSPSTSYPTISSTPPSIPSYPSTTPSYPSRPSTTPSYPISPISYAPSVPTYPPLPLFRFNFDEGNLRFKKFGAKGRRKYTPSFSALVFNIKGKQPKSPSIKALGIRPITKGFKWEFGRIKI